MNLTKYTSLAFCTLLFGCSNLQQGAENNAAKPTFSEQHRPQFHFTPPSGWMNDPNGMVYYAGEYHLFYQHNPDSTVWGPMHWGHAVSNDLVHWEHLPIALYPDSLGTIFSGSAVVDYRNTSGLGTKENPPLVAIFTYHNTEGERAGRNDFQSQGIAYSLDKGRSWTKYENNPVLPNPGIRDFRDPKVMWYEAEQKWVMALAVADHISFYSSKDLKAWTHESDFGANVGAHGGVWECPDLFEMPVAGSDQKKWVLLVSINPGGPNGGSATQYFVGDFDGKNFVLDPEFARELNARHPLPQGQLFADFEGNSYGAWKAEGEAFGEAPVQGTLPNQIQVRGHQGQGLVNSYRNGDASTGKLTSPAFTLSSKYINLLLGGGKHPEGTAVKLIVEGKAVRRATGNNTETLNWLAWDVREFKGKSAHIEIIDSVSGGWGHILLDHILFSDAPAKAHREGIWIDYGRDNYAGVSWSGVPEEDGRRLFMGWMSNWSYANVVPTENWRSAMTVARSLQLEPTEAGLRLSSQPVEELKNIHGARHTLKEQEVSGSLNVSEALSFSSPTFALKLELETAEASEGFAILLSNTQGQTLRLGYDAGRNEYFIDRSQVGGKEFSEEFPGVHWAPRFGTGRRHSIELLADLASVEFFADGGKTVMTDILFPEEPVSRISLEATGGTLQLKSAEVIELKSIWTAKNEN